MQDVIVGGALGDLCIVRPTNTGNSFLQFQHSEKQRSYLFHKYLIFKEYVKNAPVIKHSTSPMTGNATTSWIFRTKSEPLFNKYLVKKQFLIA